VADERKTGVGKVRSKVVGPEGTVFPTCPDIVRRHTGLLALGECFYHFFCKLKSN